MSAPLDPKVQAVVNAARAVIRARPHFGFSPDGPIGPQAVDALIKLETALYAMPPFYHTLGNGEVWCVRGAAAIEDGERVCVAGSFDHAIKIARLLNEHAERER